MPTQYHSHVRSDQQDEPKGYLVRFDRVVYDALVAAASDTNRSMNSLVNEAVARYLAKPGRGDRSHYQETIRKLGGQT